MSTDQNNNKEDDNHSWSTWEELLLGCAVKRHGFKNWDSVAMELQTRSTVPNLLITAQTCRQKYLELRCRFTAVGDGNHNDDDDDEIDTLPWLEDLRQLRVAELKQEVQRYDVSILSLQSKVKRLESEREASLKENAVSHGKPDLEDSEGERSETDKNEGADEPVKQDTKLLAGKSISGENRSVNGSNSTTAKGENQETGEEDQKPVDTGYDKPDPVSYERKALVVEDSYNGSSEPNQTRKGGESSEPRDSAAQSKESSDVQSSASLTRKRRRQREIPSPEIGEFSREIKRIAVKSHPLVEILEAIQSHKNGSLFERRLNSQESDKYKNTIRQHVDLETVKARLEQGAYSSGNLTFYRDLLLLFNNAILFFSKSSVESTTAHELRTLVSTHLHKQPKIQAQAHTPSPEPTCSPPIISQPKPELGRSDSLLAKHKSSVPILVCRKRSSIATKPSTSFSQKVEPKSEEKKPDFELKQPAKLSSNVAEEETEIKPKERTVITGSRSMRRGNKTQENSNNASKKVNTSIGSNEKEVIPKTEKKKPEAVGALDKKRSAADFLKRIKRNSPGETVKTNSRTEQKKKVNEKVKEKEKVGGGGGKKDDGSPSKRNVGRPAKKGMENSNKRGRESEGTKDVAASKQPKKRTRR